MGTARPDKVDRTSTFRAPLNAAWGDSLVGDVVGVGLNSTGKIVAGAGQTGVVGVVCLTEAAAAGTVVDVFHDGTDIADFTTLADDSTATIVATNYYANVSTGVVTTTATGAPVGFTVQTNGVRRLIVRIGAPAA